MVIGFVALVAAAGIALTKRLVTSSEEGGIAALTPGAGMTIPFSDHPVPMAPLAFTDLNGIPMSSEAWKGRVVLVNFWATWCGPCRAEIPALVALQQHYKDHVVIVGLSIDELPAAEVKAFADQLGVTYPVAMATPADEKTFGSISAVPLTFVINPNGEIVQRHVGALDPRRTEHEIRLLAGLPTEARAQLVPDTGQVLLANAAYATEIPGVDLSALTPAQKVKALQRMNTDHCTCGCGLTVAECRINDPSCTVSPSVAAAIVDQVKAAASGLD